MTQKQIIEQLKKLSNKERLTIAEEALRLIHQDYEGPQKTKQSSKHKELEEAAKNLLRDYKSDPELTSFTVLDSEDFREKG